jgi:hypothetical protein
MPVLHSADENALMGKMWRGPVHRKYPVAAKRNKGREGMLDVANLLMFMLSLLFMLLLLLLALVLLVLVLLVLVLLVLLLLVLVLLVLVLLVLVLLLLIISDSTYCPLIRNIESNTLGLLHI